MSNQWISRLRKRLEDNRRYRRAMAEISTLTTRDLADMRGNREEMQRYLYEEIYGRETAEVLHFNLAMAYDGSWLALARTQRDRTGILAHPQDSGSGRRAGACPALAAGGSPTPKPTKGPAPHLPHCSAEPMCRACDYDMGNEIEKQDPWPLGFVPATR